MFQKLADKVSRWMKHKNTSDKKVLIFEFWIQAAELWIKIKAMLNFHSAFVQFL